MKTTFNHPIAIYCVTTIAALCIMIIIDYLLGKEAEHLNAWVIVNRLLGQDTGIGDSLAIKNLGLMGATLVMLFVNSIFGIVLIQILKSAIKFFHS